MTGRTVMCILYVIVCVCKHTVGVHYITIRMVMQRFHGRIYRTTHELKICKNITKVSTYNRGVDISKLQNNNKFMK